MKESTANDKFSKVERKGTSTNKNKVFSRQIAGPSNKVNLLVTRQRKMKIKSELPSTEINVLNNVSTFSKVFM